MRKTKTLKKKKLKSNYLSENELDLITYKKEITQYRENPITYTHDEIKKILNIK